MKRTLFALMLLAASVRGLGDGTFSAKNLGGNPIIGQDGQPLSKLVGKVEILDGETVLASGGLVKDGFFVLGVVYDPTPGATADITVRAWDASVAFSYAAARAAGYGFCFVTVKGVRLASGTNLPLDLTSFGFSGFAIIDCPEPKSVTLACVGLGGLILLGRRFNGS